MTAPRRDGNEDPRSFNAWTRKQPEIDSKKGYTWCDLDVVWHQYAIITRGSLDRTLQNMMVIETKSNGARLGDCQRETLRFLRAHIKGKKTKGRREFPVIEKTPNTRGRVVTHRFWGFYLLAFSGFGPLDSEKIEWNGKEITTGQLLLLLLFRLNPMTFHPRDERDHHGKRDQGLLDLDFSDGTAMGA